MRRCWNCGLPDVAERCPRCGAPQEQERRGPGGPPSVPLPGGMRPAPGAMGNGAPGMVRPPGPQSAPLPPAARPMQSGPLPPGRRPADYQSGPLPPAARPMQSGPLPPELPRGPLPGGANRPAYPGAGPDGWGAPNDVPPQGPRRASSPLLRPGSGPLVDGPPSYELAGDGHGGPPGRLLARPSTGAMPPVRPMTARDGDEPEELFSGPPPERAFSRSQPRGWEEDEDGPPELVAAARSALATPMQRKSGWDERRAPEEFEQRSRALWNEDALLGSDEPALLTISAALNAVLGAAVGGVFGGLIWLGVVIVTDLSPPYLTLVVGLMAGLGARFAVMQTRPWTVGLCAALGAALAFLITQYGLFDYALAAEQARQGLFSTWFPLSPLEFVRVYMAYVTGTPDGVNSTLGQSGTHPQALLEMLVCVAACWSLLLRRKR